MKINESATLCVQKVKKDIIKASQVIAEFNPSWDNYINLLIKENV